MAIVNAPMLSNIVSLAQGEIAFNFLKAIKDLEKKAQEMGSELPRFVNYSEPQFVTDDGSTVGLLVLSDWVERIEALLDPEGTIGVVYYALDNRGISLSMIYQDVDVLRLVIESVVAECTTHAVEFESREGRFAVHGRDWIRIVQIEQADTIEETVPYYRDEEELGRSIFEAEAKKIVCDALKGLVMASVVSASAQYQTRTLEALKACMSTFDLNSPDTLRQFESVCHELTAANVATRQAAVRASIGDHRVYKPQEGSSVKWKPSDPKIAASKRVAERHRRGMTIIDACVHEGISNGTYYAAMRYLANA